MILEGPANGNIYIYIYLKPKAHVLSMSYFLVVCVNNQRTARESSEGKLNSSK